MAKVKLLLDEDVHLALGVALRNRGVDVIHVQELDRKGCSDRAQLIYAVETQRCLYSFNVKDFVVLHNSYLEQELEHWGIAVSQQLPVGESLRRILKMLQQISQDDIKTELIFL